MFSLEIFCLFGVIDNFVYSITGVSNFKLKMSNSLSVANLPKTNQNEYEKIGNSEPSECENRKECVEQHRFINLSEIDLHGLSNIFDAYATKKTYATTFFNLALITTNFSQIRQLIDVSEASHSWSGMRIITLIFVCMSLALQCIVGVVLVFLARHGEFVDEEKREQLIKNNNAVTALIMAISVMNVFINVFTNV